MKTGESLSPEEIRAFMAHFREFVSKFESQSKAGEAVGVKQQYVSQLLNSASPSFGLGFLRSAEKAMGLTLKEMVLRQRGLPVGASPASNDTRGGAPVRTVEYTPRYHNLGLAVRKADREGKPWPSWVVSSAEQQMDLLSDEDPRVAEWESILRDIKRQGEAGFTGAAKRLGISSRIEEDDLRTEDIEPPSSETGTTGLRRRPEIGHSPTRAKR